MRTGEMSALDTAFLCLEHPSTPMHIGAVAIFEPHREADTTRVTGLLSERVRRVPQLHRRIRTSWFPWTNPYWETDRRFRAEEHVRVHELPWPGGPGELTDLASRVAAEPLDLSRPPWELHVITGLQHGRFALLIKLHHALADGARAVEIGLGLLDGFEVKAAPRSSSTPQPNDAPERGWVSIAREGLTSLSRPERLARTTATVANECHRMLRRSSRALDIGRSVAEHARLPASDSPLLALPSTNKRVELLSLETQDLRRLRTRHGGTTNDMLLAVITGALRLWLTSRGHHVDDLTLRALIPVNHRSRAAGRTGNNQLSGYLCDLPVSEPDPEVRLRAVRESMTRNKSTNPLRGPGALPVLAEQLPAATHRLMTRAVGHCAPLLFDTVITNVPLPNVPAALDGAGLRELYPLVPVAAGHSLSIAASQYRDRVHVGLQAGREALPDIEKLNEALPHALAELDDLPS
ncbi:WS/DGAT/MGAT family acyltransferase [Saccharopolyspora lacisalsi]|uniref:Diacylglycerol O-acyltransferase n=1 Tax=Halosaccharopolyspora lacisalsi TaxID=1000566 RepID=A0A839E1Z8_9PSEU|nr:wax ester/triacylglycerol synthase family O-acyltransferase [Halosaccharopolyspora lacisalsi]MBA8824968.1 WS/DGAT/MGAT family acyltransferase [Halosaccharopolyspora lacisalsi]